ncbi:ROK family protein [Amphibacillus sp. MSJ-3]|uniref:ROK family protein n=1 Tax=Amphibacillus sp. MSJ-3 TaxID=2841505 RepID=UPI001C0F32B2|nr:ROK family protein [Amphibacillus sp. MSJ-3]MBU5594742.1 ROK family protein [Amphibacillus sp. MSJ-3]
MYLGFDIGGTFVKYAWMERSGRQVEQGKFPTPYDSAEYLVEKMVEVYHQTPEEIKGIAISCPGTIDIDTGMVYYGGALTYLHEKNIAQMLSESCGLPVSIENDGKCAALAERWQGSVKDYRHSIVLTFGTGVGGGIIIDGKLHRGANLEAGEQSYVMETFNHETNHAEFVGPACSASDMVNEIAKLKGLDENDGIGAFEYINAKDPEALEVFNHFCKNVAIQILNLQYIIDPDVFAIGGGISIQPAFLQGINEAIELIKRENPHHMARPKIVTCHFNSSANLYGALYHYLLQHESIE